MEQQRFIKFTALADSDVRNNVMKYTILEDLCRAINFSLYSGKISSLTFVFIVLNPHFQFKKEDFLKHRRKNNSIEFGINIDYDYFKSTNENDATSILAETYLRGIEKFLIGRKDFDGIHFYDDVKKLFIENNLLRV